MPDEMSSRADLLDGMEQSCTDIPAIAHENYSGSVTGSVDDRHMLQEDERLQRLLISMLRQENVDESKLVAKASSPSKSFHEENDQESRCCALVYRCRSSI